MTSLFSHTSKIENNIRYKDFFVLVSNPYFLQKIISILINLFTINYKIDYNFKIIQNQGYQSFKFRLSCRMSKMS